MQTETPKEKGSELIKLSELAGDINEQFRQSNTLAVESIKTSGAAVKAAVRTGQLLTRAKRIVGHGGWLKWLADNCPDIGHATASRWMGLANSSRLRNLGDAKTLQEAYKRVGLLPEIEKQKKGIGTATINIFDQLFQKFERGLGPVIDIAADIDPQGMPQDQRHAFLERAKPMVEFIDRVKALEGV